MNEKPNVLIAEDEVALGQIVKESLESRNFKVEFAEDGEIALKVFQEKRPGVVVLDVMMPKVDGYTVAREIRKIDKNVPIIFLTAKSQSADVVEGFRMGGNDYLKKPFSMEELIVRINSLLCRKISASGPDESSSPILPIRTGNKTILLNINKIRYILASGYYAEIYSKANNYVIRESLGNLLDNLDTGIFFRVHRSAIINLNYVQEIVHSGYSEIDVRMKDSKLIRISKSQKKDFLNLVKVK